ncbi:hypothetical protein [Algoriphagus hitonicola]|nr:hypothetical protein [Algoriphagus hitonicola]
MKEGLLLGKFLRRATAEMSFRLARSVLLRSTHDASEGARLL